MKRDLIAEGRLLCNVVDALRFALDERPTGCRESALWHGVKACGVARGIFDEAIEIMLDAGWASRRHGRLFSGLAQRRLCESHQSIDAGVAAESVQSRKRFRRRG